MSGSLLNPTNFRENQNFDKKKLRFPIDSNFKSKIEFQPYKVLPAKIKFRGPIPTEESNAFAGEFGGPTGQTGLSPIKIQQIKEEKTELFLPLQFSVRDGIQYTDASLGLFGGRAYEAITGGEGLSGGLKEAIQGMGDSLVGLFDTLSGSGQLGALAAARAAQLPAVPQVARDIIGLAGRVTINPNTRTAFNGVSTRDFLFQFDFYPKSERESETIYYIIRNFRLNAYPGRAKTDTRVPIAYEYPNLYKIRLLSGRDGSKIFRNIGTPIKLSYLQNIEANYSRNQGEGLFKNGAPTHVQLSLNFKEYKALDRDDIIAEENDGFYHYEGQKAL